MQKVFVDLAKDSYDIIIDRGLLDRAADYIVSQGGKVFVVSDTNVAPLYCDRLLSCLVAKGYQCKSYVIKAGESSKNIASITPMYSAMIDFGLTRSDLVVALGGGVVGDLTGFVASTYLRGVSFVQIPTSLLAQVDSSVGGKVAVDLAEGKNLVGSFYQPVKVLIDTALLDTLPDKFYVDGMAEIIKYGCILDKELFDKLSAIGSRTEFMDHAEEIIARCCSIKATVVSHDEKDKGERMLLNFGHTYGHALEKYYDFKTLTHGQAVAIGMSYITAKSEKMGLSPQGTKEKIDKVLANYGLASDDSADPAKVVQYVVNDKKNLGKDLVVVILQEIGKGVLYRTDKEFFD
ncbi:MAG: 3-dehydroquinate synthase [Christensenellales bacterium]